MSAVLAFTPNQEDATLADYGKRDAEPQDYEAILEVTSIVRDFYAAAEKFVSENQALSACMKNPEFKGLNASVMFKAIANDSCHRMHELFDSQDPSSYSQDLFRRIDAEANLVSGRSLDKYLGTVGKFMDTGMFASLLPESGNQFPQKHATVLEKYGMRHTAKAMLHNWAITLG